MVRWHPATTFDKALRKFLLRVLRIISHVYAEQKSWYWRSRQLLILFPWLHSQPLQGFSIWASQTSMASYRAGETPSGLRLKACTADRSSYNFIVGILSISARWKPEQNTQSGGGRRALCQQSGTVGAALWKVHIQKALLIWKK